MGTLVAVELALLQRWAAGEAGAPLGVPKRRRVILLQECPLDHDGGWHRVVDRHVNPPLDGPRGAWAQLWRAPIPVPLEVMPYRPSLILGKVSNGPLASPQRAGGVG